MERFHIVLVSLVQSIFASNSKWFTAYDTTVTTAARVTWLTASPTTSTRTATSITIAQGRIAEGFGHWMDKLTNRQATIIFIMNLLAFNYN